MFSGYQLVDELDRGDSYVLYRGLRRADASPVLLKCPLRAASGGAGLAALAREHEILSSLELEGVARPRDFDPATGTLVLEDVGAEPLSSLLASGRPSLEEFFEIAIGLARALSEIHRRSLTHKNVNPHSVLVEPRRRRIQLVDFSIASRRSEERASANLGLLTPGRLRYISPEQTGRMNRVVDHRTDLYSLGAVLYEVLTGRPPFVSDDPLELVHAHIARIPPEAAEVEPSVPPALSRIVAKLLAKPAERRYQSGAGVRHDLELCRERWTARRAIEPFALGERDVSDRFTVPQYLYGREEEIAALLAAFDRACQGPATLMLVSGYSGVGKTSLVREVHKPIVRRKGRFLSGKFDQLDRNVPYRAIRQALRGLVLGILSEGEERIAAVREAVRRALGSNAGVVGELVPELDLLAGPLPPAAPLPATESQNRFNHAIESFLEVFAGPEHPLVLFLDDLQWADSASLNLLLFLLGNAEVTHLFLIGAYRSHEVGPEHPLAKTLAEIRETGDAVREIALTPLRLPHLTELVGEALRCSAPEAEPLARLVLGKTDGNPFFVTQFLRSLPGEGLLAFDHHALRWVFDLDRIRQAGITENVIALMTRKLERLSPRARQATTLAACIGNSFSLSTLAIVREKALSEAAAELWEAIEAGLIFPVSDGYEQLSGAPEEVLKGADPSFRFLHDRVQQAAYALISDDQKRPVHLRVGRLLLGKSGERLPDERIFEIANHLNLGQGLLSDEGERMRLARLNLKAGRKAKASAAFQAALGYFEAGRRLLSERQWDSDYELTFELHLESAEGLFLCGRCDEAERELEHLSGRARTRLDQARVSLLKITQCESLSRYFDAIRIGHEALALFGLAFPALPGEREAALDAELAAIRELLAGRPIHALLDLPQMEDPESRMVMKLLTCLHTSCYLSADKVLTLLNTAAMVRLSLARGNVEESAYAYVLHAMHLGSIRGDHASAYEFGRLALNLSERFGDPGLRARVQMNFAWNVSLWRRPMSESLPVTREAFRLGNESGLFVEAAYALFNECWFTLLTGRELSATDRTTAAMLEYLHRIKMGRFAAAPQAIRQWARCLAGATEHALSFTDEAFDEEAFVKTYRGDGFFDMFYFVAKLAVLYTFDEHRMAADAAREAERLVREYAGTIWDELTVYYSALTLAALTSSGGTLDPDAAAKLNDFAARMAVWADNSPANFRAQHLILLSEIARTEGSDAKTIELYQAAIEAAAGSPCPREAALANEAYARFWLSRGQGKLAAVFLAEARNAYADWGAAAKVKHLERRYPDLLRARAAREPHAATLDFATAMKAAHAIAGEIELEKLLKKLIRITIENAGAERGLLLEEDGERLVVAAEGSAREDAAVLPNTPVESRRDLPLGLVRLVARTGESVLVGDAEKDPQWSADPYVTAARPRSILCVPIVSQGKRKGLLYLENNLAAHAFTSERIELMQILAAQAAISLENAELYEETRQEVGRRRQAEEKLREALSSLEELKNRLQAENVYLQEEIRTQHNFEEIVGNSPALLAALAEVEQVARTDSTVLLLGETGTGKELFARAIHSRSARSARPLVKVNCGAIPEGLVESELFGHVRGAFTGALDKRIGRFDLADGGTIFLDEVVELPLETQVKLLRVLQEKEFEPVGSSRTVRVNVRVLAASNRDLEGAVRSGAFRTDLLYRLNVFPIRVPPLRERRPDIPLLATFLLASLSKRLGKRLDGFSRASMERLMSYSWPGNVREFQNVVERAAILARAPVLEVGKDLLGPGTAAPVSGPRTLEELERMHIQAALLSTGGVVEGPRGAASILGLHPNTLRSRIKRLGIERGRPREIS